MSDVETLKLLKELRIWHYGKGPCDRPLCKRIDAILAAHGVEL